MDEVLQAKETLEFLRRGGAKGRDLLEQRRRLEGLELREARLRNAVSRNQPQPRIPDEIVGMPGAQRQ
jgi:hypothetical protein